MQRVSNAVRQADASRVALTLTLSLKSPFLFSPWNRLHPHFSTDKRL